MVALSELFPPYVASCALDGAMSPDPLYPSEALHVARAVPKRRTEYALGRTCARRALAAIGVAPRPLPSLPDRSVAWPDEALGSITHADGLCAAVAALRTHVRGIGIDVELRNRVHEGLWESIATERELRFIRSVPSEACSRATQLFSAKEAFYKAQFCASRAWVGFHDAELTLEPSGRFEVTLLIDAGEAFTRGTRFEGRILLTAEHVVSGLLIPIHA